MLKNAYFLAKIGADTAENERKFAEIKPEICQKLATTLLEDGRGPSRPAAHRLVAASSFCKEATLSRAKPVA